MAPNEVNDKNRDEVFKRLYGKTNFPPICRFNKGDKVRLPTKKSVFDKGYKANWSAEIYEVVGVFNDGSVCYYSVSDSEGKTLTRKFYAEELNLVLKYATPDPPQ